MRITALLLLLAMSCGLDAQAPVNPLEANLAKAKADFDRDPSSVDNAIEVGLRLGEVGFERVDGGLRRERA